jgi:hypothetical protein
VNAACAGEFEAVRIANPRYSRIQFCATEAAVAEILIAGWMCWRPRKLALYAANAETHSKPAAISGIREQG